MRAPPPPPARPTVSRILTPRERQVADLLGAGFSNKEIAGQLQLSEGTVKVYVSDVYRKTGLTRVGVGRVAMADDRRRQLIVFNSWFTKWAGSMPGAAADEFRIALQGEIREVFFEGSD